MSHRTQAQIVPAGFDELHRPGTRAIEPRDRVGEGGAPSVGCAGGGAETFLSRV